MESVQPEQAANSANRLGITLSQPHLLPDLGFSSSVCGIIDESFPYVSGIFDDTLNPSFMSNGPVAPSEIPDQLKPLQKNHEEQTVSKNSWLSISVENGQLDDSMSFTLPRSNNEDVANVTETNLKEELSGQPESTSLQSCLEKSDSEGQSKNGTFNNSLKERSPRLNSAKHLLSESPESNKSAELQEKSVGLCSIVSTENAGLEDKSEKHLNSTVDISGSANVTSEHPTTEKLDCTVDITQSSVPKQEHSSEKPGAEEKLDCTVDISQSSVVKQEQDKKRLSSTERLNEKLDCTVEINNLNVAKQEQDNSRLSSSSREQPNMKLECSVASTKSDVPELEPNLGLNSSKESEKHSTFTKVAETNSIGDLTADMEKNSCASSHVSTLVSQPSSISLEQVDGTFTKHNATTDLAPVGSVSSSANATMNITNNPSIDLPLESSPNNGLEHVKDPVPVPVSTATAVSIEIALCSNRTLDFVEAESKVLEQPDVLRRRKGISDSESCINLDISLNSMFSLDETLDMKATPLVASTPIVLSRGFDRLGSIRPIDMQQRLSVINNMDRHPNNDATSDANDGSEALKTNPPSAGSETSSQIQTVSTKGTSNSSTSEPVTINKLPSKLAIRRKIPQPSKSNIPKTQISLRPPVSQLASVAGKSKSVAAAQTLNQPKVSSSALHSMRRTAQLNNRKNLAPVKNTMTTLTPKSSSLAASGCNLTADMKSSNTGLVQPKSSGLQLPGRGRFALKPAGTEETGLSQTTCRQTGLSGIRTRSSLLPGLSQKHASSDALPLAKRKKTDLQNQPPCAEGAPSAKLGGGAQKVIAAPIDLRTKGLKNDCPNCALLQDKLQTFHQELGGFLQELGRIPADCGNWTSFQQTFELCLAEFKRLQAAHQ